MSFNCLRALASKSARSAWLRNCLGLSLSCLVLRVHSSLYAGKRRASWCVGGRPPHPKPTPHTASHKPRRIYDLIDAYASRKHTVHSLTRAPTHIHSTTKVQASRRRSFPCKPNEPPPHRLGRRQQRGRQVRVCLLPSFVPCVLYRQSHSPLCTNHNPPTLLTLTE